MKKCYSIIIMLIICLLVMTGCGSNSQDEEPTKLKLTEENVQTIENSVIRKMDSVGYVSLANMYTTDILRAANARISAGSHDSKDVSKYTSIKVTSYEKYDDYEYRVYGNIIGNDDYNNTIEKQMYISFYCEDSGDGSCSIDYGFSINAQ